MDFFERQDQARRSTKKLVVYFALAVIGIIAAVYLVCVFAFGATQAKQHHGEVVLAWWNRDLFFYSVMGTLAVITCGSLYQISALSAGGSAVAESLGGRLLNAGSKDPLERKLLNIVEEMSIASGVPMPKVYVMDDEPGINAFAAGHNPTDAAVAVTRGCLETLNRDELQGVIGHEFSHILNGDMRLNLRLMGIIFGILCLATVGRILLYTRGKKNPLPLLGLALMAIGGLGVFFGRLIQAAVSRQREFLADAAAVQFTRNPAGLSGALKKIATQGSKIENPHAADACHMFFGNGMSSTLFSWFATHPPLEERIRALEPTWDGKLAESRAARPPQETARPRPQFANVSGLAGSEAIPRASVPPVIRAHTAMPNVGELQPMHLRYAEDLRNSFPEAVVDAAHSTEGATALVFALLVSSEPALQAQQLAGVAQQVNPAIAHQIALLLPEVMLLAVRARLPLFNIALPALRQMTPADYAQFLRALKWLAESDRRIDLFEYVLQKAVQRHLAPHFNPGRPPAAQYYTIQPLVPDLEIVLSALAYTGSTNEAAINKAFQAGVPHARAGTDPIRLRPRQECGLNHIDAALNRLALAAPPIKRNVLTAAVQIVGADGVIQEREAELLRAVADTLDVPMPPFVGE